MGLRRRNTNGPNVNCHVVSHERNSYPTLIVTPYKKNKKKNRKKKKKKKKKEKKKKRKKKK